MWNLFSINIFKFLIQNLSLELNFFKWDDKLSKIQCLLFRRIWKIKFIYVLHHKVHSEALLKSTEGVVWLIRVGALIGRGQADKRLH